MCVYVAHFLTDQVLEGGQAKGQSGLAEEGFASILDETNVSALRELFRTWVDVHQSSEWLHS